MMNLRNVYVKLLLLRMYNTESQFDESRRGKKVVSRDRNERRVS